MFNIIASDIISQSKSDTYTKVLVILLGAYLQTEWRYLYLSIIYKYNEVDKKKYNPYNSMKKSTPKWMTDSYFFIHCHQDEREPQEFMGKWHRL